MSVEPPLIFKVPVPLIAVPIVFVPPVTFKVPAFLIAAFEFVEFKLILLMFAVPPDALFTTEPSLFTALVILTLFNVNVFPDDTSKPVLPFMFNVDLLFPLATPDTVELP